MHRGSRFGAYLFISCVSSSLFFNWPQAQNFLVHTGAYRWLCDTDAAPCLDQVDAIRTLALPAGVASMFVFALFGGIALDFLGPKLTAFLGLGVQVSGWLLLPWCRTSAAYLRAVILIGLGNDPVQFALINGASMFPEYRFAAIGALMAARTLGFCVPTILNGRLDVGWSVVHVCCGYAGVLLLAAVLVGCVIPWKRLEFSETTRDEVVLDPCNGPCSATAPDSFYVAEHLPLPSKHDHRDARSVLSLSTTTAGSSLAHGSSPAGAGGYKLSEGFRASRVIPKDGYYCYASAENEKDTNGSCPARPRPEDCCPASFGGDDRQFLPLSPSSSSSFWSRRCAGLPPFGGGLHRPALYLPLFPIAATTILAVTFSGGSSQEQYTGGALTFSTHMAYLAFVPGLCIGVLAQRQGPLMTMFLMNTLTLLQFLLLLLKDLLPILMYAAAFVGSTVASFFLAQFYCFVSAHFADRYFGTLTGTIIMFSGIVSLVATPMCDFSSFEGNFQPMNGLCMALTALNFAFLGLLAHASRPPRKDTSFV